MVEELSPLVRAVRTMEESATPNMASTSVQGGQLLIVQKRRGQVTRLEIRGRMSLGETKEAARQLRLPGL
jgi:hypothetical protein